MILADQVHTYAQLRAYLDQQYGSVEELRVTAIISQGLDAPVPHSYRLSDGTEFTIPIIFTAENERIVDPDFDLKSLPIV